jgi:hypothetical protein
MSLRRLVNLDQQLRQLLGATPKRSLSVLLWIAEDTLKQVWA